VVPYSIGAIGTTSGPTQVQINGIEALDDTLCDFHQIYARGLLQHLYFINHLPGKPFHPLEKTEARSADAERSGNQ
jgi:hypothetical protein